MDIGNERERNLLFDRFECTGILFIRDSDTNNITSGKMETIDLLHCRGYIRRP